MAIESIVKTLVLDEVINTLLLEQVRRKYFESTNEALVVHGRSKEKDNKREKGRSKSHGRHKSPRKSKEKCWNYNKVGYFRRDYKEEKKKNKKEMNDSNDESKKSSQEDGGDAFVAVLETRASQSAWLINLGASFHMTSHRHWFSVYKKYDGGMVYLGNDSPLISIVGQGRVLIRFIDRRIKGISGVLCILSLTQNLIS
jgi:hypothetical protein